MKGLDRRKKRLKHCPSSRAERELVKRKRLHQSPRKLTLINKPPLKGSSPKKKLSHLWRTLPCKNMARKLRRVLRRRTREAALTSLWAMETIYI